VYVIPCFSIHSLLSGSKRWLIVIDTSRRTAFLPSCGTLERMATLLS
jgi:hypothetical protein